MGNLPVKIGDRVESVTGYYRQVELYEKKCELARGNHRYTTPPNGSLAWPGERELLETYGVSIEDITNEVAKLIQIADEEVHTSILKPGIEDKDVTYLLVDHYDVVKTTVPFKEEVFCHYCNTSNFHESMYKIRNLLNQEEIVVTDYRNHMMQNHQDLGNRKDSRLLPEKFCKVLGLGNTELQKTDDLFKVAKYYSMDLKELEDQLVEDKLLFTFPINATLMMSASSGRASKSDVNLI